MRKTWSIFGFLTLMPTTTLWGMEKSHLILETSPDAALMGNVSMHSEINVRKHWFGLMALEHSNFDDRGRMTSGSIDSVHGGVRFYPEVAANHGPFLGVGAGVTYGRYHVERLRPSRTYFQPSDGSDRDRWSTTAISAELEQSMGYRLNFSNFITASVGVQAAEKLHTTARITDEILMPDAQPDPLKLPRVSSKIFLNLGIYFQ